MHNAHESIVHIQWFTNLLCLCFSTSLCFFYIYIYIYIYIYLIWKAWMSLVERTQKKFMLFNFFKSSRNHDNICPLLLPTKPKPIPFSTTSSSGNKVVSNSDFNHSNLVMQFVCHSGLPTYVASMADFQRSMLICRRRN
jgi:hypothetical protein